MIWLSFSVLVGGGDVLLGTGASDEGAVAGRAGLRTLAERTVAGLRERGVSGDVRVSLDLRLFEGEAVNPAWDTAVESGDIAPLQALATYGGREQVGTGQDRIADPAAFAAARFARHLADVVAETGADLRVTAEDEAPATAAERAVVLDTSPVAQVESAPVGEVVAYMLAHSENQVAEALARTAAYAVGRAPTAAGAAELLADTAADLGADTAGMRVLDASGLAEEDRVSTAQLAAAVVGASRVPSLAAVLDGLPRPGEDSTLAERFRGTAAEHAVAAKTGTLDHTVSLTGTVQTRGGRVLAFSVIASELEGSLADARSAVDEAVVALAEL